jgi:hypothetical protein
MYIQHSIRDTNEKFVKSQPMKNNVKNTTKPKQKGRCWCNLWSRAATAVTHNFGPGYLQNICSLEERFRRKPEISLVAQTTSEGQ